MGFEKSGQSCRVRIQPPIIPGNHFSVHFRFLSGIKMTEADPGAVWIANFFNSNAMGSAFNRS